jgi:peptidoglycan/xylan/chitin deacetylase (PgdA/CDA1 family)
LRWRKISRSLAHGVPVLCYHQFKPEPKTVYDISPGKFREQMEYLKVNGYRVAPLGELVEALEQGLEMPEKTVVITIDDGYKSVYQHALPVLREYGYPATLFLYVSFIREKGGSLWWPEIQELIAAGIDIGSHSFSHFKLTRAKDETVERYARRLEKELLASKHYLENKLDVDIPWFSYPYGAYDLEVLRKVAGYGYRGAVVLNGGVAGAASDRYAINRKLPTENMSEAQFARALTYHPMLVGEQFPVDGGRIFRSQLKELRINLPDWDQRGSLRMTINGEYMNLSRRDDAPETELRFRNVPSLRGKANCVNVLGNDERGNRYVHSFLFWLEAEDKK